jgi:hypothetical protein
MQTSLNSIYSAAGSAVAHIPDLLSLLSQRHIRMASTSEELLDLFEERYSEQQEPEYSTKTDGPAFSCEAIQAPRVFRQPREVAGRKTMNTIPFILAVGASLIAILAALLWRASNKARNEKAGLVKVRLAQLRERQLGAYEKARIDRFLNEVNTGRITFEQAQHAIGSEWIAAYGPNLHAKARMGGQSR